MTDFYTVTIRDHIMEIAGLPVTIGIARTRTLAKLFSDTAKPSGAAGARTLVRGPDG